MTDVGFTAMIENKSHIGTSSRELNYGRQLPVSHANIKTEIETCELANR
jgi:hypothetical protein